MHDQTRDRVAAVIDDLFGVPSAALTDDVALSDGLQLDSLSVVELQAALEDTFGIRLDHTAGGSVETFGELVAAVRAAGRGEARSA